VSAKLLLNSWKEIASFVGRSERTVQRWEKWYGLPVCRPSGRERSAVIALASEIEAWTLGAHRAAGETTLTSEERASPKPESRPTVLCIDCHSQRLAMRKLVTESSGYHVLAALDISSGLRLFNDNRVDVVILEFPMHPLDSDSIARQLHRSRPEVPILILSRQAKLIPQVVLNLISDSAHKLTQALNSNPAAADLPSKEETRKGCVQETSDARKDIAA
jgi:CheY-like chemotaxis protein